MNCNFTHVHWGFNLQQRDGSTCSPAEDRDMAIPASDLQHAGTCYAVYEAAAAARHACAYPAHFSHAIAQPIESKTARRTQQSCRCIPTSSLDAIHQVARASHQAPAAIKMCWTARCCTFKGATSTCRRSKRTPALNGSSRFAPLSILDMPLAHVPPNGVGMLPYVLCSAPQTIRTSGACIDAAVKRYKRGCSESRHAFACQSARTGYHNSSRCRRGI